MVGGHTLKEQQKGGKKTRWGEGTGRTGDVPLPCRLHGHMTKQVGHRLSVVGSANGLGKDHGDIDTLYFGTLLHMLVLWNGVCNHHSLKAGVVDP